MITGIDIGGSKTRAVLYDEEGNIIRHIETESCHLMNASAQEIMQRLKTADLDPSSPVVIGYAGYERSVIMRQKINDIVHAVFHNRPVTIMSDLDLAFLSALGGRDGTIAILGTGSVVMKKEKGQIQKKGGWGYILGDEGSGYAIGRKVLRVFAREADERLPKSIISDEVSRMFHLQNVNDLINAVLTDGRPDRSKIASASRIVTKHPDCAPCHKILEESAQDVVQLILSVTKVNETVMGMGGMMKAQSYIQMINALADGRFYLQSSLHEPVYGAFIYSQKGKTNDYQK